MADELESGELAAEDKAYFESRGEKIPQEKPTPDKVEKPDEKEAKAETEAETDLDVLDEEAPKEDKKVPLRALTKEREEGKKARQALQELEKRHAVLEDRWNTILQLNQQPEVKAEDPEPDPNQDIFAHNAWLKRQVEKVNKTVADRDQSDKAAKDEAQREAAVWNYWGESSKAAAAETPDFADAVKWMSETRTKQLSAMKAFQPQFQTQAGIDQQINAELKQIVIAAAQKGVNAGTVVYEMAKEWGYAGPAPKEEPKPEDGAIDKLSKNLDAETSLSGAGGSRPGGALDSKAIADMNNEDFDRWLSKAGPNGFKKLFQRGGTA